MKLRFRLPSSPNPQEWEFDGEVPLGALLAFLEETAAMPHGSARLLKGFPPRAIDASISQRIGDLFSSDEVIIVQKGDGSVTQGHTDGKYIPPAASRATFQVRPMPPDNSCLFHSLAFLLENRGTTLTGPQLRQRVADVVRSHPSKFNAAFLGMENAAYVEWIRTPTTWGGAVEIHVASFLYQTMIIAVDLSSRTMHKFGERENYSTMCFVAYTGNHYDALVLVAADQPGEQSVFNSRDERVKGHAEAFLSSFARTK